MEDIKIELGPREVMICIEALQEHAKKHATDRELTRYIIKRILNEVAEGYTNDDE